MRREGQSTLAWTVTHLASVFVPVSRPATRPTGLCSCRLPELMLLNLRYRFEMEVTEDSNFSSAYGLT